jgi:hypothetical protein
MSGGRRRWFHGPMLLWRTAVGTAEMLKRQRLGFLVPVLGLLLSLAAVMWLVNAVAPLAPFVYSLF